MIPEWLGDFGRGLSEQELGTALAGQIARLAELLGEAWQPSPRGRIRVDNYAFWPSTDATQTTRMWRSSAERVKVADTPTRHGIALELGHQKRLPLPRGFDPVWFAETLGFAEDVSAV